MKGIFMFLLVGLATLGFYYYSGYGELENVKVEGDTVVVDTGDFVAELSISGEFSQTYMLFGGGYFKEKNLINPISLSGLGIADAKNTYAEYPDFHLCKSAGAPAAQNKVRHLSLIPASKSVLNELKSLIKEHEKNFAKGAERICVALTGKTLTPNSKEVPGKDSTKEMQIIHQIPPGPFYLVNASKKVDCKTLLD